MTLRTTSHRPAAHRISSETASQPATQPAMSAGAHGRRPLGVRRPGLCLAVAAAGALMANVLTAGQPAAHADLQSVSIAKQLGVDGQSPSTVRPLEQLVASRSQRDTAQSVAALAQSRADQAELDKRAAAAAAAKRAALVAARAELAKRAEAAAAAAAAAKAAAAKAAAAAAAAPAPAPAPAAAPAASAPAASGSYQDYALSKVGAGQFSCLESLWGRESGWNPNAQNPSSSAYGIPQFLDSTWASTGIAKTSDGYRQIDAGLIYLDSRYGSPCGGWAHSQATGWY